MKFVNLGSIRKNLSLLIIMAILPALAILWYSGMEQRRNSIESAKNEVALRAHAMAEVQKNIAISTRQLLSTLAQLPDIQSLNTKASTEIFRNVLAENPDYLTMTLTDSTGQVIASDKPFPPTNLGDRKHVRDAMTQKTFAIGEYVTSRIGTQVPALPFAHPVLDKEGNPKAVLTTIITLSRFAKFHGISNLPGKSFVAITDHKGIRLFYYPAEDSTNPIGKPIRAAAWEQASKAQEPGIFISAGSDGVRRIMAFEQVRLNAGMAPPLYAWAGVPEGEILKPANAILVRNALLMCLATALSLTFSLTIAKSTLLFPIMTLVSLTRKFGAGDLDVRSELEDSPDEFGKLTRAFHDMASDLHTSLKTRKENEARFRLLMNSMDALIYVADMTTYEVLFINEYGKNLLGDITGKICWQTIQQGQSGPCPFCTNKYLVDKQGNPGEVHTWEFQNTVSGSWFFIKDRAIRWTDGRLVRVEIATDISEKKLTEARLAEERERLTVTLGSIGDGVITTDTEGRIAMVNKVAETLTGWDNAAASGRPLAEVFNIINEETRLPCDSPLNKVLAAGEIVILAEHTTLIARNGQERNIADSGAPIRDKDGTIIGMVLVFRDITEQLRTEKELLKIKKLESVGVLAGGIAHDFNNILTAILGNLGLSLLDATLPEKTQKLLREAEKASWRARDLTQQLLTFAKGGQPIKETAALAEIVKDSADFILRGSKVACRYLFPDDLWLVDIDKGQISQVVQNIILNASNAMPNGGAIEVTGKNISPADSEANEFLKKGRYVKLRITDSGVGIAPNLLEKIFDPYFSTKQHGSGLGLAITHSIINKHGGHISVESTLGVGTTFTIYLPASDENSVTVKQSAEGHLDVRKSTILIMDDDESVRDMVQAILSQMGHQVLLAQDGTDAIHMYQQAKDSGVTIDLTIMDLTIPGGMGGIEAVQQFLAIDPLAKVVVSSGYSNDPVMANFKKYGFCAAIAKPYQIKELTKVITQFLV